MWQSWTNTVVGLWMILSGIIGSLTTSANFIVVGIVLAILGFSSRGWRGTVLGIIGLWTVFSGLVPGLTTPVNLIVFGVIATVLAIWKGTVMARHHTPMPAAHH